MFSLKVVKGPEPAQGTVKPMRLPPAPARLTIGRDPHLDWPLADRTLSVSARHCEIVVSPDGVLLRDLSTNGTFVNGSPVRMAQDHKLVAGDVFDVGPYRIAVEALKAGEPVAELAAVPRKTAEDADAPLTRIRPPPRGVPPAPSRSDDATPARREDAAPAPRPAAPLLDALAAGLGLDAAALAGRDPVELARSVGQIARTAVSGLRRLLEQEARARRRLGSRLSTQAIRDASPLRVARTPEDTLLRLLSASDGGQQTLRQANDELAGHHDHLTAAFAGAVRRLGEHLDPAALEAAVGPTDSERKAQLWDLYLGLWRSLGMTAEETWTQGFIEAAMLHLAAAYDEGHDESAAGTRGTGP